MAVITFPTALESYVAQQAIGQRRFDTFDASDVTGAVDVVVGGPPRWTMELQAHAGMELAIAGQWDALLLQLRGGVNHLAVHDLLRPLPSGTARGSDITATSTVALGATSVGVTGARWSTNLLRYPQRLDLSPWAGSVAVTANTDTAPDTSLTADTITDDSVVVTEDRVQSVTVPADTQTYTASVWVKKTTGGTSKTFGFYLFFSGGTGVGNTVRVNTDSGAVLAGSATVTSDGSYWRVVASATNNGTNNSLGVGLAPAFAAHGLSANDPTQTGSAVVWEVKLEVGGSASGYGGHPTLRTGDWLQIGTGVGSHYAKVTADVTLFDGIGSVSFEPPTRQSYASGSAITIEKARGHFKRASSTAGWANVPGALMSGGHGLELVEQWS